MEMDESTYLNEIFAIFKESQAPLSAKEIAIKLKSKGLFRRNDNLEDITPGQIRNRIRKNSSLFDIKKTKPITYRLKKKESHLWVLKTVVESETASQINSYGDRLEEFYNFDSNVANFKQVKEGDLTILIDKEKILGFARIGKVTESIGIKTIKRCPFCPSTTIDKRSKLKPTYRCNKGHVFDDLLETKQSVKRYSAHFDKFVPIQGYSSDLLQLRPYYVSGYNRNMSMQLLDPDALRLFEGIYDHLQSLRLYNEITAEDAYVEEDGANSYLSEDYDERDTIIRAIKLRRGQKQFRDKLLKRYDNTCAVTGCKIPDVLEAAHIKSYRGKNDNHISNGILLRADIHTLFDLNLVAIEPETLLVHFHPKVAVEYSKYHLRKILVPDKIISSTSLIPRWIAKLF
jgi:putative restriction endonuclease